MKKPDYGIRRKFFYKKTSVSQKWKEEGNWNGRGNPGGVVIKGTPIARTKKQGGQER